MALIFFFFLATSCHQGLCHQAMWSFEDWSCRHPLSRCEIKYGRWKFGNFGHRRAGESCHECPIACKESWSRFRCLFSAYGNDKHVTRRAGWLCKKRVWMWWVWKESRVAVWFLIQKMQLSFLETTLEFNGPISTSMAKLFWRLSMPVNHMLAQGLLGTPLRRKSLTEA